MFDSYKFKKAIYDCQLPVNSCEDLRGNTTNVHGFLKIYFSKRSLKNKHRTSVHDGLKPFNCFLRADLTRHIASVHEGKKPFNCSLCDCNFSRKDRLTRHIASVHEFNL